MIDTTAALGYAVPLAPAAGETVAFHLSSASLASVEAGVFRVRCGDPDPAGPGLKLQPMPSPLDGPLPLTFQPIRIGSAVVVPDRLPLGAAGSLSLGCFAWPTLPGNGAEQAMIARAMDGEGWWLGLDGDGHAVFEVAGSRVRGPKPLLDREWVFLAASYDAATGALSLSQASLDPQAGRDRSGTAAGSAPAGVAWPMDTPLLIGARALGEAHFNGKVDRPRLHASVLEAGSLRALAEALNPGPGDPRLVGAWDFSLGISGRIAHDRSANGLHGRTVNLPARGVTGANWDGSTAAWPAAPQLYGAIHFHDDDLEDAGWSPNVSLAIPADWPSGFYALRLTATRPDGGQVESHVPFFVRTPLGRARAKLAFVASTATFLAYANSALRLDQIHAEAMLEGLLVLSHDDCYLQEHRELGLSTYDTHTDGSGWMYSTALRPILNMRPRGNTFNYVNDTHLIDWMEQQGFAYDIITDHDLHHDGAALLGQYTAVITGSHPEYYSTRMWDAFDAYQRGGGRHLYLGGNGFYWRIGFDPDLPHSIEVRRDVAGTRTWEGEPGEACLSWTGEPAGLWRTNGRAPQRLTGVGFSGQVFDRSGWYRRLPGSFDERIAFVCEGIGPDERIGDFGLRGGGAAGLEMDRVEPTLGSAPDLVWLATADRLGPGGLPSPEEFRTSHRGLDGEQSNRVRSDMTFTPTANGGGVFTTGSIAWVCSLSHAGYDNNVSRIMGNVLRRFLDPAPFAGF